MATIDHGGVQKGYNYNQGRGIQKNHPGDQSGNKGQDLGINSIKTYLLTINGDSDPDAYLTWNSNYDKIFRVNNLIEIKKSFYAIE